ncbi:MAG: HTH domain-containing protein [Polyangia bacterium]
MTFTEAALEILQGEGRPLHAKEIAARALERGLLSHVGKTPVQTMSARLSAAVAKGPDKQPFRRERPGVFALVEWGDSPPGPREPRPGDEPKKKEAARDEGKNESAPEERGQPSGEAGKKKKKRSRAKKKKDAGGQPAQEPKPKSKKSGTESQGAAGQEKQSSKKKRGRKKSPPAGSSGDEDRRESNERGGEKQAQPKPKPKSKPKVAPGVEPADRVEEILREHTKSVPVEKLADQIGVAGRGACALIEALLVADGIDRERSGIRPRFVRHRAGWALAEREISTEIIQLENGVVDATRRLSRIAEKQMLRKIRGLSLPTLVRLVVTFLRRTGFSAMRAVERGGDDSFHLSVQDRRRDGRFRTAVVVSRDAPDSPVGEADVTAVRGALHHYDSTSAMILTTGEISDAARREAEVPNLAPVALVDGESLARELVEAGVGVRARRVSLPTFDEEFFGALAD